MAQVGATLAEADTANVAPQRDYVPMERRGASRSGAQVRAMSRITVPGGP